MVDAGASKAPVLRGVRVRIPLRARTAGDVCAGQVENAEIALPGREFTVKAPGEVTEPEAAVTVMSPVMAE